jgi:hypothetical protein
MLHLRVVGTLTAVPFLGLVLILASCSGVEGEAQTGTGSVDGLRTSPATVPSPSPPPDPTITETGIRHLIPVQGGGYSGLNLCEADGSVPVLSGRVVGPGHGPPSFTATPGEAVYHKDGTLADDPVLTTVPVNRRPDGKLEAGWRHCEFIPDATPLPSSPLPLPAPIP